MSAHSLNKVEAIDFWHNRPVYRARIVNSDTAAIVVKSARALEVGRRISFAHLSDLQRGTPRDWRSGVIWRIDKGCLHLTRT
jgi:hypothetical protein